MTNLADFSNNALRRISPADRASLGKRGETAEEAMTSYIAKHEGDLQKEIRKLLDLRGIEYINPPMHKRSQLPEGWPDVTFHLNASIAVEVKHESRKLRPGQKKRIAKLLNNGWHVFVIRRLTEFRDLLNAYQSNTATGRTNILPEELQP